MRVLPALNTGREEVGNPVPASSLNAVHDHQFMRVLPALNTGGEQVGDPVPASFLNAVHDHPFMRVLPALNTGGEQVGDPVPVSCLGACKTMTVMKYFSWLHHAPNALFGCSCLPAHMYAFSVSRKLLSTVILSMSV